MLVDILFIFLNFNLIFFFKWKMFYKKVIYTVLIKDIFREKQVFEFQHSN